MGAHSTGSNDHGVVVYTTDSDGVVLAKRYLNSVPDTVRSCPFSMVDVDQWWKLPAGCLVNEGVVFYEQMISCGYWDGSWRIHCRRRRAPAADRLPQEAYSLYGAQ